jgi:subfamily B ATP-binding cassette protein MsbA
MINQQSSELYNPYTLYKRLWTYMAEYKVRFCISIVAMIIAAATEPAFARIMKPLVDKGFNQQNATTIILVPIAIILIFFIRAIASYTNDYMTSWLSGSVVEKMRELMFSRLLKLPVYYYDNNNSGRILSRILFDVTQITDAGFNIITVTFKDGITVIALLGVLLYTDWQLTLFCFLTLPAVLVLIRLLAKRLRGLSKVNQQQYGDMTQVINEAITGQKIVKLFASIKYEQQRFSRVVRKIKTNNVKQAATASLNSGVSQFLVAIALAMILYFAANKSRHSNFTVGDFISFLTAMLMIFAPMKRITSVIQSLQRGLTAAESVFAFLDNTEEQNNGTIELSNISQGIEFKKVFFAYDKNKERQVLEDISFKLPCGQTLAIVGSSGSGKTTLAHLIPRFYNIENGSIEIDGHNIIDIELTSLRKNIAFVSQDVILFNDTIANNIAYGGQNSNIHLEKVMQAIKLANADEFIHNLPDGINTYIGENGMRLSGGQKQRIAIARAIYKQAPLLILDEATSALDNRSEKLVQQALDYLMLQKQTTIVIAHRLSTIINADMIMVLEQGKIVEKGIHQELMNKNGVYANLYHLHYANNTNTTNNNEI